MHTKIADFINPGNCLTPELILNVCDQLLPHLTHARESESQFSSSCNNSIGMYRFISFMNKLL